MTKRILDGKRVLIVEDEMLIALLIEDVLEEFGCTTLGPCGTVRKAMDMAQSESFDLALLDVNLNGEKVYPVAEFLVWAADPVRVPVGLWGGSNSPELSGRNGVR